MKFPFLAGALFLAGAIGAFSDVGNQGAWGDQGDGTYLNPILPGDFSDPDVIRVGGDYYFITSTFQYSPGMAIMHSKDLVNWQFIGHCIPDVSAISPEMNWNRMNRYNRGVYAGSLRYHDGKFWMFTTTLDEGVFLTTAAKPEGPWSPALKIAEIKHPDDPCPLWDDDGKAYLILSTPGTKWFTHLYNMSPDGRRVDLSSDRILDRTQTSEGNKIYKFKDTYYVFHNQCLGPGGRNRVGVMMRSKSIEGPWEKKVILENAPGRPDLEPNQGGLVDTEKGDWWFITQQGTGRWEGRASNLLPVRWIDGWPIPGTIDPSGAGNITWHEKKPIDGFPIAVPQSSDEFDQTTLAPQWEWNYEPRADKWSLSERPGFLRLHAFKPLVPGNFFKAGNTLTQRVIGYEGGEIVVKADVSGMADGQTAGVCAFWKPAALLGVVQKAGLRTIQLKNDQTVTAGPVVTGSDVWLKLIIGDQASCTFAYSLDGKTFTPLGGSFKFGWANYRGTRFGLYCWNEDAEAGRVDFDFFRYAYKGPRMAAGARP